MTPEQIEEIAERRKFRELLDELDYRACGGHPDHPEPNPIFRKASDAIRLLQVDLSRGISSHRELQERVEALENALDQVASLMHGLPRGKTADHVERICREAYRQGE